MAEVAITRDIHYVQDKEQFIDVYQPDGCGRNGRACPVAMWVHGSGWRHGNTSNEKSSEMQTLWAKQGIVMVGVNYRLSPRVKHPAHVEDVAAAIAWVHANIGKFGGDATNVSLLGHSAGAHLVALVATNPRFLMRYGLIPHDALANVFPIDTASFNLSSSSRFIKKLVDSAFGDDPATLADASPIKQVRRDGRYPAFIIAVTKIRSNAVATSQELASRLRESGTPVSVIIKDYPGARQLQAHGMIAKELANPESEMTQTL